MSPVFSYRCRDTIKCRYRFRTYFSETNPTGKLDIVACPKCRKELADKLNPQLEENEHANI